jgi:calcium-dependent protein kinase
MPSSLGKRRQAADTVVAVDKVAGRGSLPISCRYTTSRTLETDYRIEPKVVGSGMSGPVRLATGRGDDRKYAVKSFKKTGMSARKREELKSEAEIYLSLDHPHVARLEMVYETDEDLHLVMEYMAGGELYDRLAARKQYTEEAAAEATHQMLLAVSYLHAHRIAHRDLKLENFLYMSQDSTHLKIIDFGFAKFTEQSTKMSQACGSIHYVAPEVLAHAYTEKADMWSIGVIAYMLLTGGPPFHGTDDEVLRKIKTASVHWSSRYHKLSTPAKDFLQKLLVLDPAKRLSAQEALDHPWIKGRHDSEETPIDKGTLESLRSFANASQFRRNVFSMMAWSMSAEDRMELRKQFLSIDTDKAGTIALKDFKCVLAKRFGVDDAEAEEIFKSLDTDNNDEIEYTEFLAAALLGHVKVHENILRQTFVRFDRDGDGKIDCEELHTVLGDTFSLADIEELLREADTSGDGKLDYDEFLAYFHKPEPEAGPRSKRRQHTEKLGLVIDHLRSFGEHGRLKSVNPAESSEHMSLKQEPDQPMCRSKTTPAPRNSLPTLLNNIRVGLRSK